MANPVAFTVLSHETPNYFRLLKSARRFGWDFRGVFFHDGTHLPDAERHSHFLARKHLYIREAIINLGLDDKTPFFFVDAFDTVFIGPPPSVTTMGLCFGGEKNCYPEKGYAFAFREKTPFPYLNSGVIWGSGGKYRLLCPTNLGHDQLMWTREYVQGANLVIDTSASIALTLHSTDPEDLDASGLYKPTNSRPVVLHGNGGWPIPSWAMEYGK